MSEYMTKSKATQMSEMQQAHKSPHPRPVATTMLISKRAYEIYVENGCKEGQSEKNWLQAEQELKNREEWLQANKEMKTW